MPTTKTPTLMTALYERLENAGLAKEQIRYIQKTALPSWWNDNVTTSAGFAEGAMLIAEHTGLSLLSLLKPDAPIEYDSCATPCFKRHTDANDEKMKFTVSVARQAACLTAEAMTTPYAGAPESITEIRRQILATAPGVMTLEKLMDWCWKQGIPVIHLSGLPAHKPQAMAVRVKGRPVIVLCDSNRYDAWQAFLVGHELTHIAKGHLPLADGFQYDTREDLASDDENEKIANQGAKLLLFGNRNAAYSLNKLLPAVGLAADARAFAERVPCDPCAVLLNVFYGDKDKVRLVMATLKLLAPDDDAPAKIRKKTSMNLAWAELSYDDAQFLKKVSGLLL